MLFAIIFNFEWFSLIEKLKMEWKENINERTNERNEITILTDRREQKSLVHNLNKSAT